MKVKIYTTPQCTWCKRVKNLLDECGVEYEEIDVSQNEEAAEKMMEISGQTGVPVTDVEGKIITGFDEPELKKALKTN